MRKQILLFSALFWTSLIIYFCLKDAKNIPLINIVHLDKLIHAIFHLVFTTLWFLYFKKKTQNPNNGRLLLFSVIGSFCFGIVIEMIQQYFTASRSGDILDVLANLFGALLAVKLILLLNAYNKLIDRL